VSAATRAKPSETSIVIVETSVSATVRLASASRYSSPEGACSSGSRSSSSATDPLSRPNLLGVDGFERRTLLEARDLALGGIALRDREIRARADLVGHGLHPREQGLQPGARRNRLAAAEVDELTGEAVADRAPDVLLDQPVRQVRQRFAFVVGA